MAPTAPTARTARRAPRYARPSGCSAPSSAGIGTSVVPVGILENGDSPTGTLVLRLHRPGQQCASPSQPPFWLAQVEVHGNGAYSASLPFGPPPPFDQLGTWIWSATYVGDARNELTHTICGAFTTNVTKRNPGLSLHELDSSAVRAGSLRGRPWGVLCLPAEQRVDPRTARSRRRGLHGNTRLRAIRDDVYLRGTSRPTRGGDVATASNVPG